MEREQDRYMRIRKCLMSEDHYSNPRHTHRDSTIACVLAWAALHERPMSWACHKGNWPRHVLPKYLPTQSCMSRRARTRQVMDLLQRAFDRLRENLPKGLLKFIDAKPLPVGGCSKDQDALYGRAASCKAKGYKLYAIVDAESREILGASILGVGGDEAVHAVLDSMAAKAPFTTLQHTVHIHPTVAELIPTILGELQPPKP